MTVSGLPPIAVAVGGLIFVGGLIIYFIRKSA
jgi:hypothetical protein